MLTVAVPKAWLAAPMAKPCALAQWTPIKLNQGGPSKAPNNPARIIANAVIELFPFNCSVKAMAIGVVTDFNDKDTAISGAATKTIVSIKLTQTVIIIAKVNKDTIVLHCFFMVLRC